MTRKRNSENDLGISTGASAAPARRSTASRVRAKHVVPAETPLTTAEPELAPAQTVAAVPVSKPRHEEVAELAYLYWEARGCQGGSQEEDWLRAEQELRARAYAPVAATA
jgi:hypothetical protein